MVVIDSFTSKNRDCRVLEDIEAVFAGVQGKSFNAHTKVAVEEIFYIAAAAPGVISTNVMVKGAEHGVAFTGTLYDIQQPKIRIVLGVGESIGAPEIHIPFIVAVPLRTRRRRDLLHFFFRDFFSRIAIGAENLGEVTEPRGHGRFRFGAFATEEPGKGDKDISHRRIVGAAEQGRDIQASLRCRFPRDCWTDDKTVHEIAACVFDGEILIFHFYADFQTLVRQENGSHDALGEAPFAAAVAGVLLFEEPVHGPLKALAEILGEEQTKFVGIGNFGRSALFLLFFSRRRRWTFFVSNSADTEFVFGEECWIKRNLVPISKSPSCFQTHCLCAATTIKSFELCFRGNPKTIGQTHFDLLSEKIIGRPVAEPLALKNLAEEKCPWRQNVGPRCVEKPAARKSWRRAVGTGHFLAAHDDLLLGNSRLRADRLVASKKKQASACDQRDEPPPPNSTRKERFTHKFRESLQNCNDWQEKFLDNLNLWRVHPAEMLSARPLRRVSNPQDALAACLCSDRWLRENKRDGCAATHLALNPGGSTVEFDDRFYQSQVGRGTTVTL